MKQAKRLKQALRDLRRFQAIVRLAKHYDREDQKVMNEPGRTRKLIDLLADKGLTTPEDQAYAESVERRIKIRGEIVDRALDPNAKITSTPTIPTGSSPEDRVALIYSAAVQVYGDVLIMDKMMKSGMDMDQAVAWHHRIKDWDDEVANVIHPLMEHDPIWTNRFPYDKSDPLWVKLVPDNTTQIHIPYATELTARAPRDLSDNLKGVTVKVVDDEPVDVSSSVAEVIISIGEDSIAKRVVGDTPAEREANMQKFMESQTSDEAAVFRQTLLRTKHLGVTPRNAGSTEREVPDRSTGESEANRDGYMSGDDEFRRIDPVKFAEE